MSTVLETATAEPAPVPNGDVPTTVTHYQQLAANLKSAIAAVMAEIPKFEMSIERKRHVVGAHQSVPPEFIATVSSAVVATDVGLEKVFDTADAQNVLQFVEAFRPLVDDASGLAAGLSFTVKAQYSRVAASALNAYAILQRLAHDGDGTLKRHVQNMRRDLGRFRPRSREKAPPSAPATPAGSEKKPA